MGTAMASSPATPLSAAERTAHTDRLRAGSAILVLSVLAGFANFVAVEGVVAAGDAAKTAADIAESGIFRIGVVAWLAVVLLDVVAACAVHRAFSGVSSRASTPTATLRQTYSALPLAVLGYLTWRSEFLPRWVGGLLVVAGVGYAFDTIAGVLTQGASPVVSSVTLVGEFLLAIVLVRRGLAGAGQAVANTQRQPELVAPT